MPKITISEQDLTISNEVDITANVVYVPGMTEKLVDEKPTLYTSVSKFKEVYGEPYKFVSPQLVDGKTIIGSGEFEKSYVYTIELLSAGVPIMFQNIVSIADYQVKNGDAITSDAGALQAFYIKLKGIEIEGGNQQLSDSIGSISTGTYANINNTNTWIDGNQESHKATYTLKEISNKDDIYNIDVLGVVPYSIESIVGLPEGNRFAVRLHCNGASRAIGGSIKINTGGSTGTSNDFGPEAFEASDDSQGAYDLIVVVNVKTSTKIEVKAEWEVTENKGTDDENTYNVSKTYVFHIDTAVLQKDVDDSETVATSEYSIYSTILDKWTYNIKYLTTGGYPTVVNEDLGLLQTLLKASAVRGDSISLIDTLYEENIYTSFNNLNNLIEIDDINTYTLKGTNNCNLNYTLNDNRKDESILKYGTVIGPGGIYNTQEIKLYYNSENKDNNTIVFPGSFGYLTSLAYNIDILKNSNYLAIAGVTRGNIKNLVSLISETTGAEADAVQVRPTQTGSDEGVGVISLNPIVKVQNYGYCIWGNRTLFPNPEKDLAASSFLNVRVLSADVKKIIYNACQKLTFETNSIELWLKFKTEIEPLLNTMISDGVLEKFEITRLSTTAKATLAVYVKLYTIYAVEDFDITVALTDSTVEQVG